MFVPQRNLDEVFGTSNEIHELLQAGFVILDKRCVVSVVLLYMPVMCCCSSCESVLVVSVMHCFVCDVYCVVSVLLPWTSGLRASWRGLNVLDSVTPTVVQQLQQLDQAT